MRVLWQPPLQEVSTISKKGVDVFHHEPKIYWTEKQSVKHIIFTGNNKIRPNIDYVDSQKYFAQVNFTLWVKNAENK